MTLTVSPPFAEPTAEPGRSPGANGLEGLAPIPIQIEDVRHETLQGKPALRVVLSIA
jgi:hypothetical protein